MDLKDLESTSTYAIEAVYRDYWFMLPEKYRLLEQAQRPEHGTYDIDVYENLPEHQKPRVQKSTPLTYREVEKKEEQYEEDNYDSYCATLNDRNKYFDLQPFFDPELNFENRLHYKLAGISYPKRKHPWFIITWNCGNGILKSTLTNRRFDTRPVQTLAGDDVKFDFMDTEMDLTLCFTSNSMQALFALQEYIRISRREKACVDTRPHSILGSFPVSLNLIDTAISKLERTKSTLCTLTMSLKIDYVIIGNIKSAATGIIKEIHTELDEKGAGPGHHLMLTRDIINENT